MFCVLGDEGIKPGNNTFCVLGDEGLNQVTMFCVLGDEGLNQVTICFAYWVMKD